MAKKPPGCAKRTVNIKRKSGKVIATFKARSGRDCAPRTEAQRKKSTKLQRAHRGRFAEAHNSCKRQTEPFTKQYGACMKEVMRSFRR